MSVIRFMCATALATSFVMPAQAQNSAPASPAQAAPDDPSGDPAASPDNKEIIVTGTSIRGVAPAGAQVLSYGLQEIEASGATNSNQLAAIIPQNSEFAGAPAVQGAFGTTTTSNRVNLRDLGSRSGGSSPTLLLMNGRRLPGIGYLSTSPDPGLIPIGAIERLEVVTDGGSAIYGSDAVGGVVNYITRKHFDGLKIDGKFSVADSYKGVNVDTIAGKEWDWGSAYVAYSYGQHDAIYGRDRDFVKRLDWTQNPPVLLDTVCTPGNVQITGLGNFALPALTPNSFNRCDLSDAQSFFPKEKQHAVFASLDANLNSHVVFNVTAYFSTRTDVTDAGPFTASIATPPTNPFYIPIPGAPTASQNVSVSFANVFGTHNPQRNFARTWGISPSLTFDLPSRWQLRTSLNYSEGDTKVANRQLDTAALANARLGQWAAVDGPAPANAWINPYNLAATNQAVLANLNDSILVANSHNELANARVVFDGPLFSLPGGEVRVAFGSEYINEVHKRRTATLDIGDPFTLPKLGGTRNIWALFGELNVPIISPENDIPLINSFKVNLALRYDHYSDFGSTRNPRVGVTYQPVSWLTLRGNWGKSFQAPSLADTSSAVAGLVALNLGTPIFIDPAVAPKPGNSYSLFLNGAVADLKPQTAKSYSLGLDLRPPIIPGLQLSATYYNIKFSNQIGLTPIFDPGFWKAFPQYYTHFPAYGGPELTAVAALSPATASVVAGLNPNIPIYVLFDSRRRNIAVTDIDGFDVSANYSHQTSFGRIYGRLNATHRMHERVAPGVGLPLGPNIADDSNRTAGAATLGVQIKRLRVQGTLNYRDGFNVVPGAANANQSKVGDFKTVDTFVQFNFGGDKWSHDLSLSLTVNNLFDQAPAPFRGLYQGSFPGYANPELYVMGRQVQIGLSKKF